MFSNFVARRRTQFAVATTAAVWAITRLPFLSWGFGTDLDAWRVMYAAKHIANGGGYTASRLPGFPLIEYAHAALVLAFGSSYFWHNMLAALASLALALGFLKVSRSLLMTLAVLLHPLIWIGSTTTMDYVPGAALLLFAWDAARREKAHAGVLGGLAAAARASNAVAIVMARNWKSAVVWCAVAGLCFIPVLATYGLHAISYVDSEMPLRIVVYKVAQEVFGIPFLLCLAAWLGVQRGLPPNPGRLALVIGVLALPYIALPVEQSYLIPALVFLLLYVAQYFEGRWRVIAAVAIVTNSLLSFAVVDRHRYRETGEIHMQTAARGIFIQDLARRRWQLAAAKSLCVAEFPPNSLIYVGTLPLGAVERCNPKRWHRSLFDELEDENSGIILMTHFARTTVDENRGMGKRLFYLGGDGLPYQLRRIYGYDVKEIGAEELRVSGPSH